MASIPTKWPRIVVGALVLVAASCESGAVPARVHPTFSCPGTTLEATARVSFGAANELSGLAASRRNPEVLWTHNDSGDTDRVFAIATSGAFLGTYHLSGEHQEDWEDIAVGPGPDEDLDYVYVGDIGGNLGRNLVTVYRFPEPRVQIGQRPVDLTVRGVVPLRARYPGARRYDAETLLVDPRDGSLYILTKSRTKPLELFRFPAADQDPRTVFTLQGVASPRLPGPPSGGDISPDGSLVAVKGEDYTLMWHREPGAAITAAISGERCPAANGPGEAIAFSRGGARYFTIPEGRRPMLSTFRLRP